MHTRSSNAIRSRAQFYIPGNSSHAGRDDHVQQTWLITFERINNTCVRQSRFAGCCCLLEIRVLETSRSRVINRYN